MTIYHVKSDLPDYLYKTEYSPQLLATFHKATITQQSFYSYFYHKSQLSKMHFIKVSIAILMALTSAALALPVESNSIAAYVNSRLSFHICLVTRKLITNIDECSLKRSAKHMMSLKKSVRSASTIPTMSL